MRDWMVSQALVLAANIGRQLHEDARHLYVAGLVPARQIDEQFIERVSVMLGIEEISPEAGYIAPWFNAIERDDEVTAKSIEDALDAAGLHDQAMAAIDAIGRFARALHAAIKQPGGLRRVH